MTVKFEKREAIVRSKEELESAISTMCALVSDADEQVRVVGELSAAIERYMKHVIDLR